MRKTLLLMTLLAHGSAYAVYTIGMCTNGYGCGQNHISGYSGYGESGGYGDNPGGPPGGNDINNPPEFDFRTPVAEQTLPADMVGWLIWFDVANQHFSLNKKPWWLTRDMDELTQPYPPIGDECDGRYGYENAWHTVAEYVSSEVAFIEWDVYSAKDQDPGRPWGLENYGKPDGIYENFAVNEEDKGFWMACQSTGLTDPRYRYNCRYRARLPGGTAGRQANYRIWVAKGGDVMPVEHRVEVYNCFQIHEQE